MRKDHRASWPQALRTLFLPLFLVLILRWLIIEPYVIPSGSMIPTLLIHDHIFVNKLAYGIRTPFGNSWLLHWSTPKRFEVLVFRYPENPDVFYIKRVIGLPGDRIRLEKGTLRINQEAYPLLPIKNPLKLEDESIYDYYREQSHWVRYRDARQATMNEVVVPPDHYFVMGDNRDESSDSRVWGFVPFENVMGRASLIWLACEKTLESSQMLCDPSALRWNRIFTQPDGKLESKP